MEEFFPTPGKISYAKNEKSIGIIINNLNNLYYTSVAIGIKEFAGERGYNVTIISSENDHWLEVKLIDLLISNHVQGIILAPNVNSNGNKHYLNLRAANYPFVLLEEIENLNTDIVTIDNLQIIKSEVRYLFDTGHTKILYFAGSPDYLHNQERAKGFCLSFAEANLFFSEELIVDIGSDYEDIIFNTINYFKNKSRNDYPTAIICFNDHQALAVMMALKHLKISVPGHISIIGNDDNLYAKINSIPLTTTHIPHIDIGKKAAELLINNIEAAGSHSAEKIIFDTSLIVRESTRTLTV